MVMQGFGPDKTSSQIFYFVKPNLINNFQSEELKLKFLIFFLSQRSLSWCFYFFLKWGELELRFEKKSLVSGARVGLVKF